MLEFFNIFPVEKFNVLIYWKRAKHYYIWSPVKQSSIIQYSINEVMSLFHTGLHIHAYEIDPIFFSSRFDQNKNVHKFV